jgi:hypothetical protein
MLSINLDLASPRAILPSISEYQQCIPTYDIFVELADARSPILSFLHTCRGSRRASLRTYRLDIDSIIEDENYPWWNPDDDIVYILPAWNWWETNAILTWLTRSRKDDKPIPRLASLQHLALKVDRVFCGSFEVVRTGSRPLEREWLRNLPSLQSLSLFFDPLGVSGGQNPRLQERTYGSIILWEPEDISVSDCFGLRPVQIERAISSHIRPLSQGQDVPLVESFVIGWRKPRKYRES